MDLIVERTGTFLYALFKAGIAILLGWWASKVTAYIGDEQISMWIYMAALVIAGYFIGRCFSRR